MAGVFKVLGMGLMGAGRMGTAAAGAAGRGGLTAAKYAAQGGAQGLGAAVKGSGRALGTAARAAGSIHMPEFGQSDGSDKKKKKHRWLSAEIDEIDNFEIQDASDDDIDPLAPFRHHMSENTPTDLLDNIFMQAQPHLSEHPCIT